ncbi:MAG: hypothetical protein IM526_02710 [Microcystis sp. M38BS1]|uniref:hypothetical protein n=1 Tax=Microcystis sp. M38BS1 TaxID=2771188 RepID=UPI0031FDDA23|nr:hypothetical protein [Microcystis sp. M38BS1]MCA6582572.1 hypothetical protein [Pseudanabaena sp. M34BS1SP1A06MG]
MPDFTFPVVSGHSFLAPRNQVGKPFSTLFIAEDNDAHFSLNGTYDKHFPLYTLTNIVGATTSYRPSISLINRLGTETKLTGSVTPQIFKEKINRREIGRKNEIHPTLGNPNLALNRVYYREFLIPKLNPKYSLVIDNKFITNTIQKPSEQFTDLGASPSSVFEPFTKGSLVKYTNHYYRCLEPTKTYPSGNSTQWQQLPERQSIFTADIYGIFGSNVQYLQTYSEDRTFRPEQQDTSLVTYNVSCFYG